MSRHAQTRANIKPKFVQPKAGLIGPADGLLNLCALAAILPLHTIARNFEMANSLARLKRTLRSGARGLNHFDLDEDLHDDDVKQLFLCIGMPASSADSEGSARDCAYQSWLRALLLRILTRTQAFDTLQGKQSFDLGRVAEHLGLENLERYSQSVTASELKKSLEDLLHQWEGELGASYVFPVHLAENLQKISAIIPMSENEKRFLGFAILLNTESVLGTAINLISSELSMASVANVIAQLLQLEPRVATDLLQGRTELTRSGIFSFINRSHYSLDEKFDFVTDGFPRAMVEPQEDIHHVLKQYVRKAEKSRLSAPNFHYIGKQLQTVVAHLRASLEKRTNGVNVLIYGRPGTGKTELARLVANELGAMAVEIVPESTTGDPVTPIRRLRAFRVAQKFFKEAKAIIVLDECEEFFQHGMVLESTEDSAGFARKSWMNAAIESNATPSIWIANSIQNFDPAYIRRFDISFEMPMPPRDERKRIAQDVFSGALSRNSIEQITANSEVTPAMLEQAARVAANSQAINPSENTEAVVLRLLNDKLKTHTSQRIGTAKTIGVAGLGFRPESINTTTDLEALAQTIRARQQARLCVFGPPGTGKTGFGQWLASQLDRDHLVFRPSDLLDAYVGGTERNIAGAFERAEQEGAVLQFDEVDGILRSREDAQRSWEITMVNELLLQMEAFNGVFLVSTNRFDSVDIAALRRFDLVLHFDYMRPTEALRMLESVAQSLTLACTQAHRVTLLLERVRLTPGDFEQLYRRARLIEPKTADEFMKLFEELCKDKLPAQPIGFLRRA